MIAKRADRILVSFEDSAKHYAHKERVEVVGMPVRREFIYTDKEEARKELGLDQRPLVVSAFGSLGAMDMNCIMADLFKLEKDEGMPFQHIHATGSFGWRWLPALVREVGVDPEDGSGLDMREYIYNMPTVMAAADVFIGRAGASSCNEIAASGTPCILIPSPNVTDNHQEKNARVYEKNGAATVILEKECGPQVLMDKIMELLQNQEKSRQMSAALRKIVVLNSAERICDIMEDLAKH
jgi:UDP-N-acetylglucosamine--N-acetylmuramyl-(pentapeptide) pyrophosphoryl-undecaprenol N-acetylglucosamine transferase